MQTQQNGQTFCFPGIESIGDNTNMWILGDIFISNYYTIHAGQLCSRLCFAPDYGQCDWPKLRGIRG